MAPSAAEIERLKQRAFATVDERLPEFKRLLRDTVRSPSRTPPHPPRL